MTGPRPRAMVMTVAPYVGGEFKLPGVNQVIKLSSNEGAFGPPPSAAAAAQRAAAESHRYPDADSRALRQAIGARYGIDPARIVCGNGSDELLGLLIHAYAEPGSELIMSQYGFVMYGIVGMMAGARVIKVPEHDFITDVDALLAAVTPATRIVMLANPNNPTGSLMPRGEMARLQAGLPPEVLLVIDAAYAEYVDNPDYDPGIALVDASENTVMARTFSKVFGMGGLRLGWVYGPPAIIDVLNRVRPPFNVTLPTQEAGVAALAEPGWVETGFAHNRTQRARLAEALTGYGIRVWPSECNFVLADFGTPEAANAADAALRRRCIIVRAMASYALPHCLRITVGTTEENGMVIDALADWRG